MKVGADVRVGVIGIGRMGSRHARVLASLPSARLVGIADVDASRQEQARRLWGTEVFADYRLLLPRVEAVVVAVPTSLHAEVVRDCLAAGKHVLVEKPFTARPEEAAQLARAAARAGLVLQVGYVEHFDAGLVHFRRLLDRHRPLRTLETWRCNPPDDRPPDVDVVLDLMVHDLSWLLTLAEEEPAVVATRARAWARAEQAIAWLYTPGGTRCRCMVGRGASRKVRRMVVTATGLRLTWDGVARRLVMHPPGDQGAAACLELPPRTEPLRVQLEHFLECVRTGSVPRVDAWHAVAVLHLAQRVRESLVQVTLGPPAGG